MISTPKPASARRPNPVEPVRNGVWAGALALGLAAAASPLAAQDIPLSSAPGQSVPVQKYKELEMKLDALQAERERERSTLKRQLTDTAAALAQAQAAAGEARKAQLAADAEAQQLRKRPEGASPEKLQAAQREREAAEQRAQAAQRESGEARAQVQKLSAELEQAKRNAAALNAELDYLRSKLANALARLDYNAARREVAPLPRQAQTSASGATAPGPASNSPPPAPSASATARYVASQPSPWKDLAELSVPGCGDSCPTFIVMPRVGPVVLGTGDEALRVDIRHRYAMGKTEVTVRQWKAFWNAPDRDYEPQKSSDTDCYWNDNAFAKNDRMPAVCVNVPDVEAYMRWMNKRYAKTMGVQFDLPTEVEWEFAARGGRYTQNYLWDDDASTQDICLYAQIASCPENLISVGSKLANGYGLFDMIGNAREWQASSSRMWRSEFPGNGLETRPVGVSAERIVRGGGWASLFSELRLAGRLARIPGLRENYTGFRPVARLAPETDNTQKPTSLESPHEDRAVSRPDRRSQNEGKSPQADTQNLPSKNPPNRPAQ